MKLLRLLIITVILITLGSCKKVKLENVESVYGSWQWYNSSVGGVIGMVNTSHYPDDNVVFVFSYEDKISIIHNGEVIVSEENYDIFKSKYSQYGEYLIELPEHVLDKIEKCDEPLGNYIVANGYINISNTATIGNITECLVITDTKGVDMGAEGGSDFHRQSYFIPVNQ